MTLDWWSLGLQAVNAVILVWLLSRFLFKPMVKIVAERQQAAGRLLDEAASARSAAESERAAASAERKELAGQRATELQAVEQEATALRARLLQEAESEAAQQRAQAEKVLATQRDNAQALVEERATQLALDIAKRLLERLPEGMRVAAFIEGLVVALEQLPAGERQALAAETRPLTLCSARALTPEELEDCRRELARTLGHSPELTQSVDPGLIAGLELEGVSVVVRNSFRADLARLSTELNRHVIPPV